MIWARITWILLLAILGGICAAALAEDPGALSLRWLGWQVDMSVAALIALIALAIGALLLLRRLLGVFMRKA